MRFMIQACVICGALLVGADCGPASETTGPSAPNGQPQESQQAATKVDIPVSATTTEPMSGTMKNGPCDLITNSEIEAVQGEAVSTAKGSERANGTLIISQCFYQLPTFNKSVSLEVIRRDPRHPSKNAIKDFWQQRFHRREEKEEERERAEERERRARPGQSKAEEEAEGSRPQKITGIGEEAFWSVNSITGALFVLKNDAVVRIGVGGPEAQAVKIKKALALAQKGLKRL